VLVCQGRAAADGRIAPGVFADPVAIGMLRADERALVEQVRSGTAPRSGRIAYEALKATTEVVVPRTVAIDESVRVRGHPQLVLLGAGLDGRAWRLRLAGVAVYEVDHPDTQRDKRDRVRDLPAPAGDLRWVPVDLGRDDLGAALGAAGQDAAAPTTWVWEGVVPYLTPAEVEATVAAVAARSAPGSALVVNYQARSVAAAAGRLFAATLLTLSRNRSPWRDEPNRSAWSPVAMAGLLSRHGFAVASDEDNLTIAGRLPMRPEHRTSLRNGRVAVAVLQ
jgi:methyltransferase (TIGR00027 family)